MEIHAWTFIELRLKLKWLLNAKTEGDCCYLRTACGPCGRSSAPMAPVVCVGNLGMECLDTREPWPFNFITRSLPAVV